MQRSRLPHSNAHIYPPTAAPFAHTPPPQRAYFMAVFPQRLDASARAAALNAQEMRYYATRAPIKLNLTAHGRITCRNRRSK